MIIMVLLSVSLIVLVAWVRAVWRAVRRERMYRERARDEAIMQITYRIEQMSRFRRAGIDLTFDDVVAIEDLSWPVEWERAYDDLYDCRSRITAD